VSQTVKQGPISGFIQRLTGKDRAPFIDWVGTSMGRLIGMMLALRTSSPIRRLVLNDVGPFIPWQALRISDLTDEQWTHVAEHSVERLDDGRYALAWDPAVVRTWAGAGQQKGIEFGSDFLFGVDLWPVWNAVRCPTMVLRGAESELLSAATTERMRNSGPPTRIVEFAGIGHAPWLMSKHQINVVCDLLLAPGAQIVG
jgi:pimeloyl-ACP methyl ester carboxylesterase